MFFVCQVLYNLSVLDKNQQPIWDVVEVRNAIVAYANHINELQSLAMRTICNLSSEPHITRHMWDHPENREALLGVCVAGPSSVKEDAMRALRNLASNPSNQLAMWEHERTQEILVQCAMCEEGGAVQEEACSALRSLSANELCFKAMWGCVQLRGLLRELSGG